MKIVIMHARDERSTEASLGGAHLVLVVAAMLATAALIGATVQRYLTPVAPPAYSVDWTTYAQEDAEPARELAFLRENVGMLAAKVGELQAKLVGIDSLGRRVAQVAGVAYTAPELAAEINTPAQAGQVMDELFTEQQPHSVESAEELGRRLDELQARLMQQADNLRMLDVALTRSSADQARLPSTMPITNYPYLSSSYGWRRNPVTHRYAMHEGLDFAAPSNTPILAASGGVVLKAEYLAGYGNMVEIDHGDGLITRYAHASKLLVKPGDLVGRGQEIARVGSTGQSTGPHLHFEVRLAGQPLDPRLFLMSPDTGSPVVAQAPDAVASAAGQAMTR